ncbi:sulfatase/phosphatase domain-containing protein [Anatilimnocola aggregata]|uniref:sulfatase/phosphatase domain-containing protein n=1 Tax=Anatilimnocola aggregata TaxID=2528021 RepID=UPI0011A7C77B|nr:sulfatase/phosphatase domain-containing protein [Anatilimnocola aggregata]
MSQVGLLEGGSRVPLIANWPGTTPAGVVRKELVDFSDVHPTFVAFAGAKPAADRKLDGQSFAPQLLGEKGEPREWVYVQLDDRRNVRSDRWKLTSNDEFFDMKEAPHRQIPVTTDTTDADALAARAKLHAALVRLKAEDAGDPPTKRKKGKKG